MPRRYRPMPPLTKRWERALTKAIKDWEAISSGDPDMAYKAYNKPCHLCVAAMDDCRKCLVTIRSKSGDACFNAGALVDLDNIKAKRHDFSRHDFSRPEFVRAAKRVLRWLRDTLRLGLRAREKQ